jgi:glycogen phosphorylase
MPTVQTEPNASTWWSENHGADHELLVAYFSMEFGLEARLPIYSGGLGVLAGDYLKAAAELGLPLVGVGLLYRDGYFRQQLDPSGRQLEAREPFDPGTFGLVREPVSIELDLAGKLLEVAVWRYDVGSVPLYLLDADGVTDSLYGGDREHRIQQELVLGIGGVRALAALGLQPRVYHVNEGHAAFLGIERARALVERGSSTADALQEVTATTVFTTHTPVPAGNEVFAEELVLRYFGGPAGQAGISGEDLLGLGRSNGTGDFGLTPLALRLAARANAVSALHGEVARSMWAGLSPTPGAPIEHITNGIHLGTWLAPELDELLRRAGVRPEAPPSAGGWEAAQALDLDELRGVRTTLKQRLADTTGLDPSLLTIGFARRFATYKRASLVFSDLERLLALPLQIVVAGKAHPQDAAGKELLQEIVALARGPAAGRVVFLEGYDIELARLLIPGCDVWLNTPQRPYEASGTSGMKAAVNGVLNLSVLDGWWAEAYDPAYGWAIAGRSDEADAAELYDLLTDQVVPRYAARDDWASMMRSSIAELAPRFSMERAVIEYTERYYVPVAAGSRQG